MQSTHLSHADLLRFAYFLLLSSIVSVKSTSMRAAPGHQLIFVDLVSINSATYVTETWSSTFVDHLLSCLLFVVLCVSQLVDTNLGES